MRISLLHIRSVLRGTFCCIGRGRTLISSTTAAAASQQRLLAPTEAATQRVAECLASKLHAGDCICLYGSVGAGKSVFRCDFAIAAGGAHHTKSACTEVTPRALEYNQLIDKDRPGTH